MKKQKAAVNPDAAKVAQEILDLCDKRGMDREDLAYVFQIAAGLSHVEAGRAYRAREKK